MVNTIVPIDPDNNQIKYIQSKILKQIKAIETLAGLSFELFEELRKQKQGEYSSVLVKWRWAINDLL